jgi:acyl carrier protein|tara:strand:- start:25 stop:252 length:228 start_codon:yes stop_codon:yes gene_type:complete
MGKLEEIIANIFELDPSQIKKEMTPADIETWDSLSQLNLISSIENEFQIKFEIDEIFTVLKIGDIYDLLSKKGVL